jgi:hypothetical protein
MRTGGLQLIWSYPKMRGSKPGSIQNSMWCHPAKSGKMHTTTALSPGGQPHSPRVVNRTLPGGLTSQKRQTKNIMVSNKAFVTALFGGLTSQKRQTKNIMVSKKASVYLSKQKKSPRRDSNPQPPDPKSDALSIAPLGRCYTRYPIDTAKIHEKWGTRPLKKESKKKVIRSRFVRVILAQGPC